MIQLCRGYCSSIELEASIPVLGEWYGFRYWHYSEDLVYKIRTELIPEIFE